MLRVKSPVGLLFAVLVTCCLGTMLMLSPTCAQDNWVIVAQLNYNFFGHVWNTHDGTPTGNPVGWCASTATINSFRYLENQFPGIYGQTLTGGNSHIVTSRNTLKDTMDPITHKGWWEGKVNWIETLKGGVTVYGGMVTTDIDISTWKDKQWLNPGYPTWDWLSERLKRGDDVEMAINYSTYGHALTLTGLKFNDTNHNGTCDPGETRVMVYLDPNSPNGLTEVEVTVNVTGYLEFLYVYGTTPYVASVSYAFSEGPVPEPASLLVLGTAVLGMVRITIRRRR